METVVLHTNGLHTVDVQYCDCSGMERRVQLLRLGWWPATPLDPRTCATMALLRHFHLLNLQGKLPAYDFYRALELATDNVGLHRLPVSVTSLNCCFESTLTFLQDRASMFMLMVREWRHVTMAKRAGRGHNSSGIGETALPRRRRARAQRPRARAQRPRAWPPTRIADMTTGNDPGATMNAADP